MKCHPELWTRRVTNNQLVAAAFPTTPSHTALGPRENAHFQYRNMPQRHLPLSVFGNTHRLVAPPVETTLTIKYSLTHHKEWFAVLVRRSLLHLWSHHACIYVCPSHVRPWPRPELACPA